VARRRRNTKPLDPTDYDDARQIAANWPAEYLACRVARRHLWKVRHSTTIERWQYVHVEFACDNGCGVKKFAQFSNRDKDKGRRLCPPWLDYPPDYLVKGGRIAGDGVDGVTAEWMDRVLTPDVVKDGPKPRGNGTGRLAPVTSLPQHRRRKAQA
jgi:hypothetical protein